MIFLEQLPVVYIAVIILIIIPYAWRGVIIGCGNVIGNVLPIPALQVHCYPECTAKLSETML